MPWTVNHALAEEILVSTLRVPRAEAAAVLKCLPDADPDKLVIEVMGLRARFKESEVLTLERVETPRYGLSQADIDQRQYMRDSGNRFKGLGYELFDWQRRMFFFDLKITAIILLIPVIWILGACLLGALQPRYQPPTQQTQEEVFRKR